MPRRTLAFVRYFAFLATTYASAPASASLIQYFKDEQGETNWQYVANFSSSVLIVALTVALVNVAISHRKKTLANRALREIRDVLEERVKERTATLDTANTKLTHANTALAEEAAQHKATAARLEVSESYLKNILQSMPAMLIGLDSDLKITQWNACAESITGISVDAALGRGLWEAYPTITLSPEQVRDVMASGNPATFRHSQRGQYYFDIRIFPLQGELDGGAVISIDNVTQQTLAENMLIQRDKMSSMGELAATMAQDINLPLAKLLDDLETLQKKISRSDFAPEHVGPLLDDGRDRGRQMSAVIQNLLDFSRSSGEEKRAANIVEIVEHAITLAKHTLADPGGLRFQDVQLDRHFEEDLPQFPCYIAEMQQVFLALFRHCVRALSQMERDSFSPLIRIEIIECYDALWLKIQHNGRGLSSEEQHDIFEPYISHSAIGTAVQQHAEDRLSFIHFIITDHHNGQLAITSDLDIGTTFHMQLQLQK